LHVHHITYKKDMNPWDYTQNDLITLCDTCHNVWHQIYDNLPAEYVHFVVKLFDKMEQDAINKWIKENYNE